MPGKPRRVGEILDKVDHAGSWHETVSLGEIVDDIGHGAIPAIMLVPALVLVSPLSGIPGMATMMGIVIALAAIQLIFGRQSFWLPARLRRVAITRQRLRRAMGWLGRIGAFLDRISTRRLPVLTARPFSTVCASICLAVALLMPLFELVPFSASTGGAAIAIFALALLTGDGVMVIAGLTVTFGGGAALWWLAT
ncbi:MAG: exopolysaccharide biosynthesis protein [Pseudomonadota bacterium]|nr:exopolysaccharide biosynthesis protein [Pseudomonadota bacterium]